MRLILTAAHNKYAVNMLASSSSIA
jgi:hypothetical protein